MSLVSGQFPKFRSAGSISRLGLLTLVAPVLAPIFFIFDRQAAQLIATLDSATGSFPGAAFLLNQYEFLRDCRYLKNIFDNLLCKSRMVSSLNFYDFQLLEILVWAFFVLGLIRVLFELFSLQKFDRYSEKISRGGGLEGLLIGFVLLGPVTMYIMTDFNFASSSTGARNLIMHSPRAFLALSTVLVGWAAAFSAEGLLFLTWLIFRRKQAVVEN
jgi:hypothetical protein